MRFAISYDAGLLDLVQAGVVEIHLCGSTIADLEHPDRLILNLDPGEGVHWGQIIAAALEVRQPVSGSYRFKLAVGDRRIIRMPCSF